LGSGKFGHYAAPELPAGSLALRRPPSRATAAVHRSCGLASRDPDAGLNHNCLPEQRRWGSVDRGLATAPNTWQR